jgi:predicted aspartyl protease
MPEAVLRNTLRFVLLTAALLLTGNSLFALSCNVVQPHPPSEAEKAFLAADYAKAASEYQAGLASHPGDAELTAGLVRALLHQQKVHEAADAVKASLAVAPNSAALISLRGEVELRQGSPQIAMQTAGDADKLDPCNPRNHLLLADLLRINSYYASSRKQIEIAHKLDPGDPEIRGEWIGTLPLKEKIAESEAFLSSPTGNDEEEMRHWRMYLENLKKRQDEPHKACHLVSSTASTEIPFQSIMYDSNHLRAYGLDVKLNGRSARLQIDTGASGLLVTRSVAQRAGLKPFSEEEVGGIGDQGSKPGYSAYADSIRIGNLEFQDCEVDVLDSRSNLDVDGLIGMDVFSRFLVTLDYPTRKLLLGPLPPRPGESAAQGPALKTGDTEGDEDEDSSAPAKDANKDATSAKEPASAAPAPVAASSGSVPAARATKGPYDRYVAPEMKDYTPVYRVGHSLILPAGLSGKEVRLFIMDTGAFATTISPEAAREVTKLHNDSFDQVEGISGRVKKVYSADQVTFHFAHLAEKANDVVAFDTSRISKYTNMEISGFIGANTLNLLTIHIDYRDGLVKFDYDPNRGYNVKPETDLQKLFMLD